MVQNSKRSRLVPFWSGWEHWKGVLGGGWSLRGVHPKKYTCLSKKKTPPGVTAEVFSKKVKIWRTKKAQNFTRNNSPEKIWASQYFCLQNAGFWLQVLSSNPCQNALCNREQSTENAQKLAKSFIVNYFGWHRNAQIFANKSLIIRAPRNKESQYLSSLTVRTKRRIYTPA